jgi:DNA-binding transcriptional LysR family regulator
MMKNRVELAEVAAFAAIAERSSFVKAATYLGVSRSSLSETLRSLENKLGVRLLNRSSRSVALTEIGETLLNRMLPLLDGFETAIESVNDVRDKPTGTLRLTIPRPAIELVIRPILAGFLAAYPAITLEISVDGQLRDIVRERFDAGIRPGARVERDMIAIKLGACVCPVLVASPDYLRRKGRPQAPRDLERHNCILQRLPSGTLPVWIFERAGDTVEVEVGGSVITNDLDLATLAALDGVGIARVPESAVASWLASEQLLRLLDEWVPQPVELYLYYAGSKQMPAPLRALVDFLRSRPRRAMGASR